ncbi:MAG: archease [Truepera sp.]|nr:archease [Truepera sp.]
MIHHFEHTADVGFEITAGDLNALFDAARRALLEVLVSCPPHPGERLSPLELEAESLESLLVAWLDELLYLVQTRHLLPVQSAVAVSAAPVGYRLAASLNCAPLDVEAHGWQGEVKGATHHGLRLVQENGYWRARVVLDV